MTDRDLGRPTKKDLGLPAGNRSELLINGTVNLTVNNSPIRVELAGGRLMPAIACLGPRGTYTEEALESMLRGDGSNKFKEDLLQDVNARIVKKVGSGEYDLGVVAVENAISGDVNETLRTLMALDSLTILGEEIVRVDHVLAGQTGEGIEELRSHSHAFQQTKGFLDEHYPNVKRVESSSTAQAAAETREMKHGAAICSRRAAELNGLDILSENIGENPHNSTRFFLIGRGETEPTGNDTTTIVIESKDAPGTLAKYVNILTDHGINMTKLVSHPSGKLGRYLFLISMDGHSKDPILKDALANIKETEAVEKLRVLGSYKKADMPEGAYDPGAWNGDPEKDKTV